MGSYWCKSKKSVSNEETNLQTLNKGSFKGSFINLQEINLATLTSGGPDTPEVVPKVVPTVMPTVLASTEIHIDHMGNRNNPILDPDELEKQRQKVQAIRESLPAFDEGL